MPVTAPWGQQPRPEILEEISPSQLLRDPPPRRWMVEGLFSQATVALVTGDGGVGKTLVMQQLLSCAAVDKNWLDLRVEPGASMLVACEDEADELHRRQVAINRHLGRDMEDVIEGGLLLFSRAGKNNTLAYLDKKSWRMQPTDLIGQILDRALRDGVRYVVIDTATDVFAGNQNDEQHVKQFLTMLRKIAIRIQGLVILTKHPSHEGRASGTGESGSVAWHNSVRSRVYLHNDKDRGLVLDVKKANYGPSSLKMLLFYKDGVFQRLQTGTAD